MFSLPPSMYNIYLILPLVALMFGVVAVVIVVFFVICIFNWNLPTNAVRTHLWINGNNRCNFSSIETPALAYAWYTNACTRKHTHKRCTIAFHIDFSIVRLLFLFYFISFLLFSVLLSMLMLLLLLLLLFCYSHCAMYHHRKNEPTHSLGLSMKSK